jgi:hypothetical protein
MAHLAFSVGLRYRFDHEACPSLVEMGFSWQQDAIWTASWSSFPSFFLVLKSWYFYLNRIGGHLVLRQEG